MLRTQRKRCSRQGLRRMMEITLCVSVAACALSSASLLSGCEEYTVATPPPPPPPPVDPSDPDGDGFKAKSTLGKARESAEHIKDKSDAYQKKVGDFADEVFNEK